MARISEEEATSMVHYATGQGVNYLDTAYRYHDGESKALLGKAFRAGSVRR